MSNRSCTRKALLAEDIWNYATISVAHYNLKEHLSPRYDGHVSGFATGVLIKLIYQKKCPFQ